MRPDFLVMKRNRKILQHSAKGSTWEEHKYIKRIDGTYYYPDSYEGGRHLPDSEKDNRDSNKEETLSKDDVLSKLEDMTGMKREGLSNLWDLSREKGYDSKEFKELLGVLSEGDEDQAKRMTDLLKKGGSKTSLTSNDVEKLAQEVIRGNFGNGQTRKDLLGENYQEIQDRVNQLLKGSSSNISSKKMSSVSSDIVDSGKKAIEKVMESITKKQGNTEKKGIDLDTVYSVYKKKK